MEKKLARASVVARPFNDTADWTATSNFLGKFICDNDLNFVQEPWVGEFKANRSKPTATTVVNKLVTDNPKFGFYCDDFSLLIF